jgi:conjugal transfer mating pair stabilization protein TraG
MQTLTIYVTTADVTTLNAIFNGVAMICQQTVFIWGCALLASMWILLATVTQAPIAAMSGNAQGVLPKGSLSAVMPFILAMLITNPGLQSDVQVESTSNGRVTVISHVPFVISAIPATGSKLGNG